VSGLLDAEIGGEMMDRTNAMLDLITKIVLSQGAYLVVQKGDEGSKEQNLNPAKFSMTAFLKSEQVTGRGDSLEDAADALKENLIKRRDTIIERLSKELKANEGNWIFLD
jgi:hypothetical protein